MILFAAVLAFAGGAHAAVLKIVPGDIGSGKIYVPCKFDGDAQSCILDTGATFSSVAGARFKNYAVIKKMHQEGASRIATPIEDIAVKNLEIGSRVFSNVRVSREPRAEGHESVVGADILARGAMSFRFGAKPSLTLGVGAPKGALHGLVVYDDSVFSIPVKIGGSTYKALWDTGAGLTSVDPDFIAAHPKDFVFDRKLDGGKDLAGQPVVMKLYTAKRIAVGGRLFKNVRALAFGFSVVHDRIAKDIHMIIGYNVITKADWFFDPKTGAWAVTGSDRAQSRQGITRASR